MGARDYCRFVTQEGERFHVPGCYEGLYEEKLCNCDKGPKGRRRDPVFTETYEQPDWYQQIEDRLTALEEFVKSVSQEEKREG
jgi:hypothetical protein